MSPTVHAQKENSNVKQLVPPDHQAYLLRRDFLFRRQLQERESGFGEVYCVQCVRTGRLMALKMPRSGLDQKQHAEAMGMLRREADALRTLAHPNLVTMIEDASDGSHVLPYLLLEYVPGISLPTFLQEKPPTRTARLQLATGIAAGLLYMHDQGWQHNDLHPLNVVIDTRACWPLLVDFGLAGRQEELDLEGFPRGIGVEGYVHPDVVEKKAYSAVTESFQSAGLLEETLGIGGDRADLEWDASLHSCLEELRKNKGSLRALRDELIRLTLVRLHRQEDT